MSSSSPEPASPPAPLRFDAAPAVYGAVLATALAAGLSLDRSLGPGEGALALVGSCGAFWVAHVYAEGVQTRHGAGRWLTPRQVLHLGAEQLPQLLACVPVALVLLCGAIGLMGHDAAFTGAAWAGVATLFALGVLFGTQAGMGPLGAVASGVVDAVLGVAVVAIKVLLAH
ncbi:MAG: hypothetical protein U0Y82_07665 [Thermoleophilia bacterium]